MNLDVKDRGGAWEEDAARRLVALIDRFFSDDPEEARRYLAWGADTILTNDWLHMSAALGLR